MSYNRLKVGILFILLIGWVGREIHTHSEKEFRTIASNYFESQGDVKDSPSCPICQFQRNISSLWNPDFLVQKSSLIFSKEKFSSSNSSISSFTLSSIQLGRAPPLTFSI